MFTLKIENYLGEVFELTHDYSNYAVVGVSGLTYPTVNVNTATGGTVDGGYYNSSRVEMRNIVIDIIINGDIETNRKRLYRVFNAKKPSMIFFKNKNRDVKIIGYVEALESDLFTERQAVQVSIICPRPYFEALEAVQEELSYIVRKFSFPFSISEPISVSEIVDTPAATVDNAGDVECGCIITATFSGAASGLTIYNTTKQEYFGLDYNFAANDILTLNTKSGELAVSVLRGGVAYNIISSMTAGSTWLKLQVGENVFTFAADSGGSSIDITITAAALYGGV